MAQVVITGPRELRSRALSAFLSVSIPVIYVVVFGTFLLRKGDTDWDQQLAFHRIGLWSQQMYGLAKGWNPLMAGGMSLAGDPQVGVLSISMLLSHVVDPAAAIKLACLFFLFLGGVGAYHLARRFHLDGTTAWLAGSLFMGNGFILSRFSNGHTDFLGSLCLPLWMLATRASIEGGREDAAARCRRLALVVLFGMLLAVSSDGSPISFLLTLVWVGLDAAVLGVQRKSARPIVFFAGAVLTAILVDAVYFFPLIVDQFGFPRIRPRTFVDPLLFVFFLLMPFRGRILPAPTKGHEFSVYIGPVLAYLIVRYWHRIREAIPSDDQLRLELVSLLVFLIGLGSLRALGPGWPASPFDLLYALPGFRTIDVPSRFWGYLALPLALWSAIAIRAFEQTALPERRRWALGAGILVFTLGFQIGTLAQPFMSEKGRPVVPPATVPPLVTSILNVRDPLQSQASTILPDRGLIHAYNNNDYLHGRISAGAGLIRRPSPRGAAEATTARWVGWNEIRLEVPASHHPTRIVFNQNFHPLWRSTAGILSAHGSGNMMLSLPRQAEPTEITLTFRDPAALAGRVVTYWALPLAAAFLALVAWYARAEEPATVSRGLICE